MFLETLLFSCIMFVYYIPRLQHPLQEEGTIPEIDFLNIIPDT